jgi:RHS repeat-associated protein
VRFILNLRFPGQYYDRETGLHYNYFRDYDPTTGRYVESDPIGLGGGVNTYGYALQDPVSRTDPSGLYVWVIHSEMTYAGAQGAGLTDARARDLATMVPNVDFLPRTQEKENAYMHAMCQQGLSTAACQSIFNWYVKNQLDQCTWPGLAKALHAVQDSYAGGHRDMHSYAGLRSVGPGHLKADMIPSEAENAGVTGVTQNVIKAWLEKCQCHLHSGSSGTWGPGASGNW